eukprot:357121-Chlamydomonas_euryale.AAC.3
MMHAQAHAPKKQLTGVLTLLSRCMLHRPRLTSDTCPCWHDSQTTRRAREIAPPGPHACTVSRSQQWR